VEHVVIIASQLKECLILKDIAETITVGNGDSMMATKVGSLRRRVVELDGSSLNIIINEVKYVPNLCANLFSINKVVCW
jgi:hypothetical protein